MKKTVQFTIDNDLAQIEELQAQITAFAKPLRVPDKTLFEINLAVDEIIANIIQYAYDDLKNPPITVNMTVSDNTVEIKIMDSGKPFNPLDVSPPNLQDRIQERPIGGLGIHLVKSIMDAVDYRRINDTNHLVLTKHIIKEKEGKELP